MIHRTTPDHITHLIPNQVFVFGSNLQGIHGKGAAKTALQWGAKWKFATGLQGQTYAIPTKDLNLVTLPIYKIRPYVDEFIEFARSNCTLTFLVTEIGCGLAQLTPSQVAPLFRGAVDVDNIHLPARFWSVLEL